MKEWVTIELFIVDIARKDSFPLLRKLGRTIIINSFDSTREASSSYEAERTGIMDGHSELVFASSMLIHKLDQPAAGRYTLQQSVLIENYTCIVLFC